MNSFGILCVWLYVIVYIWPYMYEHMCQIVDIILIFCPRIPETKTSLLSSIDDANNLIQNPNFESAES